MGASPYRVPSERPAEAPMALTSACPLHDDEDVVAPPVAVRVEPVSATVAREWSRGDLAVYALIAVVTIVVFVVQFRP